jgi:hypothetical protein
MRVGAIGGASRTKLAINLILQNNVLADDAIEAVCWRHPIGCIRRR